MLRAIVVGDRQVIERLHRGGQAVRAAVRREVARISVLLANRIKKDKLSAAAINPHTLRAVTGTLRRSITSRIEERGSRIVGITGTNVWYGAIHETGGNFAVPEHTRWIRKAYGKPVVPPKQVTVKAYTVKFPERSFLRSTLQEMAPEIRTRLNNAVAAAVKGT